MGAKARTRSRSRWRVSPSSSSPSRTVPPPRAFRRVFPSFQTPPRIPHASPGLCTPRGNRPRPPRTHDDVSPSIRMRIPTRLTWAGFGDDVGASRERQSPNRGGHSRPRHGFLSAGFDRLGAFRRARRAAHRFARATRRAFPQRRASIANSDFRIADDNAAGRRRRRRPRFRRARRATPNRRENSSPLGTRPGTASMDAGAGAKSATTSLARAKFAGTSPPFAPADPIHGDGDRASPMPRVLRVASSDAAANALRCRTRASSSSSSSVASPRASEEDAVPLDFARSHPRPAKPDPEPSRAASTACGASRARSQDVSSMRSTGGGASRTSQNLRRSSREDHRSRSARANSPSSVVVVARGSRPGRFGMDASAGTGVMTWRRWSAWMKGWPRAGSSSGSARARASGRARGRGARARGDRRSRGLCRARRGYRGIRTHRRGGRCRRRGLCRTPRRTSSGRARRRRRRRPPPSRGARSRRAGAGRNARRTRRSKDRAPCGAIDEGDDETVARDGRSGSTRARAETTIGAPRGAYRARRAPTPRGDASRHVCPFHPSASKKMNEMRRPSRTLAPLGETNAIA